jgi:hypothetical protein
MPVFLLVLALLWAAPSATATDPPEEFVAATNLDASTIELASQLRQMILMQAGQFPEPAGTRYRELMTDALDEDALRQRVRDRLAREDESDLEMALAWLRQPDVAPMIELVTEAERDPRAQVAIQMYATTGQLGRHEVTPEREAILHDYMDASGATEAAATALIDLILMSAAFNARLLDTELQPEDEIRAQAAMVGDQMAAPMMAAALFAFRELPDEDVAAFSAAADAPGARAYNRIAAAAQSAAVVGALGDAGEAFMAEVEAMAASGEFDLEGWRAQTRAQMEQMQQGPPPPGADGHAH